LSEAQALGLLALPGQIYIPDTVKDELAYHVPSWQKPNWLTVGPLAEPHSGEALAWHQAGLYISEKRRLSRWRANFALIGC
jgi:hypothetical protein